MAKAEASAEHLAILLRKHITEMKQAGNDAALETASLKDWINTNLVMKGLGIADARDEELDEVAANTEDATTVFAAIISLRAHIGWSTHGHSAVDVNIYSSGGKAVEQLRGNHENTDVGKFLREYLAVDVDSITAELNEKMVAGRPVEVSRMLDFEMERGQKLY